MSPIEALRFWLVAASGARWKCENIEDFDKLIAQYEQRLIKLKYGG